MRAAAADLDFEEAARLRDEIKRLRATELAVIDDPTAKILPSPRAGEGRRAARRRGSRGEGASKVHKPALDEMGIALYHEVAPHRPGAGAKDAAPRASRTSTKWGRASKPSPAKRRSAPARARRSAAPACAAAGSRGDAEIVLPPPLWAPQGGRGTNTADQLIPSLSFRHSGSQAKRGCPESITTDSDYVGVDGERNDVSGSGARGWTAEQGLAADDDGENAECHRNRRRKNGPARAKGCRLGHDLLHSCATAEEASEVAAWLDEVGQRVAIEDPEESIESLMQGLAQHTRGFNDTKAVSVPGNTRRARNPPLSDAPISRA